MKNAEKYSDICLRTLTLCEARFIKSPAQFNREWRDKQKIDKAFAEDKQLQMRAERLRERLENTPSDFSAVCIFDDCFPKINIRATGGDIPFMLFARGDLSLIQKPDNNVAVIGTTSPTDEVERREGDIVRALCEEGCNIVSGLAAGCDTRAHRVCLDCGGKTVAILPSTFEKIYPSINRKLSEEIAGSGGLLISEYSSEPLSRSEAVGRFIERDRLQSLFSKAVVMIASYSVGRGGSGSRHAMEYAKKSGVARFVMYEGERDKEDKLFGLNRDYLKRGDAQAVDGGSARKIAQISPPETVSSAYYLANQIKFPDF